jgi:hypothetical protein
MTPGPIQMEMKMSDKRQQATKTARILALISVVGLGVACNGLAPTAPSEPLASNESGDVTAMSRSTGICEAVAGIDLQVVDSSRTFLWVEANYKYIGSRAVKCPAPSWHSDRSDLVVDKDNPYRAGFPRSARGKALVTAKAPNGVHNSIGLHLGDTDNCANIVAVDLQILSSGSDDGVVWIQAKYVFLGDTPDDCRVPPTFTASRPGLKIDTRDAFRAGIGEAPAPAAVPAPSSKTTVAAAAPNGVGSKITF